MMRIVVAVLILVLLPAGVIAQTGFTGRCNGKIINAGVHKMFVINNCGEPDHVESSRGSHVISGPASGEKLYYYTDKNAYIVDIFDGKVSRITKEKIK